MNLHLEVVTAICGAQHKQQGQASACIESLKQLTNLMVKTTTLCLETNATLFLWKSYTYSCKYSKRLKLRDYCLSSSALTYRTILP